MSTTEAITREELEWVMKECAIMAGSGSIVFMGEPARVAGEIFAEVLAHREPGPQPGDGEESPDLPDGTWARVEMPGYRENTGWVTEGDCFGARAAVVRDWDGGIEAEVILGPGCRVVRLPAPLRRPEPRVALPAGDSWRPRDADGDDDGGPF